MKRTERKSPPVRSAQQIAVAEGAALLDSGRFLQAEQIAREVLAADAQHMGATHLLGVALLGQGRAREAVESLQLAAQSLDNGLVETHLGKALRESGRATEAMTWLRRAAARLPPLSGTFHELGILLCALYEFQEAAKVFQRGLELAPADAELWTELGGVYIQLAEPANAKIAFARALTDAPGHPRALHGFGTALLYEGDFQRAAERFRQVLARDAAHVRARLDLAHCLLEMGQPNEAAACLRMLVQSAPQLYGKALKVLVSAGSGRFWIRPSAAASFFQGCRD
jgi:tetratricopeptide (TPR) repeat protein